MVIHGLSLAGAVPPVDWLPESGEVASWQTRHVHPQLIEVIDFPVQLSRASPLFVRGLYGLRSFEQSFHLITCRMVYSKGVGPSDGVVGVGVRVAHRGCRWPAGFVGWYPTS